MANIPEFKYAPMFQLGADDTEYYLLTKEGVSVGEFEGKPMLTVMLSEDIVKSGKKAGDMVRGAAKCIQGGGGGQPHFAQAGGRNPQGLNDAMQAMLQALGL